jgi:hypothetical protein
MCRLGSRVLLLSLTVLLVPPLGCQSEQSAPPKISQTTHRVATDHPRLWIKSSDVQRLRSWATDGNPLWKNALLPLCNEAKTAMDAGTLQKNDSGEPWGTENAIERYAALFAFMSLVSPTAQQRDDYGKRARTLLMRVINEAEKGVTASAYRWRAFSTEERSVQTGHYFALTVDWAYSYLSAADKAKIVTAFSRWIDENLYANTTAFNHPEPVGLANDPALVSDAERVRWSSTISYSAHARNLGLMGIALDPADDSSGKLAIAVNSAIGAWLYVNDYYRRTDGRGGLSADGPDTGIGSLGAIAQLLLGVHTSGYDAAQYGQQASFAKQPFWSDLLSATFASYPPRRGFLDWATIHGGKSRGMVMVTSSR